MKFLIGPGPHDFRVFLASGEEITSELAVTFFSVQMKPNELPEVTITCYPLEGVDVTTDSLHFDPKVPAKLVSVNTCAEVSLEFYVQDSLTTFTNLEKSPEVITTVQKSPEAILDEFQIK